MCSAAVEGVCGKGSSLKLGKILYERELLWDDARGAPDVLMGRFFRVFSCKEMGIFLNMQSFRVE